jgi:hypothetical protein
MVTALVGSKDMQLDLTQLVDQLLSSGVTACFTVFGGVIVLVLAHLLRKRLRRCWHFAKGEERRSGRDASSTG